MTAALASRRRPAGTRSFVDDPPGEPESARSRTITPVPAGIQPEHACARIAGQRQARHNVCSGAAWTAMLGAKVGADIGGSARPVAWPAVTFRDRCGRLLVAIDARAGGSCETVLTCCASDQ